MRCPKCGHANPPDFRFCGSCGTRLHNDLELPAYARRSPRDYTPPFLAERVLRLRSSLEGERKLVSVLFADVANFTGMAEALDPEDVHEIMDGCFEILGQEIHGAGGTINQYTGDGVMALFGAPVAHEDHINRACHAALRVQERLKEFAADLKRELGVSFKMRIGIHTGPVVVGAIGDNLRLDYTAVGDTTNLAARLQGLAQPGAVLVSERVRAGASRSFLFREAGSFEVKGKRDRVRAFVLERELEGVPEEGETQRTYPLIDRERELALLEQAFRNCIQKGPAIAAVFGEAGIGKSRLITAFKDSLLNQESARFLEAHCRPYGEAIAFYPLGRMFRAYFELSSQESPEGMHGKIRQRLKNKSLYPKLINLLGLFEEIRSERRGSEIIVQGKKRMLFKAMRDLLVSSARRQSLVLAIDNMQWIDASTREFLAFFLQSSGNAPILIICSGRAEPGSWCPVMPHCVIPVSPLSREHSSMLFSSILGTDRLEARIRDKIIANGGGNPLFLVEMGETLARRGLLVCDALSCTLSLPVEELKIPDTIRGVLAARLDALGESYKRVVQLASVIGTTFSHDLLSALMDTEEVLAEPLSGLEREGIIERISSLEGGQYRFRHQMMREVAYHALLRRDRRRYHGIVARNMEKMYKRNPRLHLASLSYHFYAAQDWEKALTYTLEAAHEARHAYACHEGLTCFNRALDILDKGSFSGQEETILRIHEWKGRLHYCVGQLKEAEAAFRTLLKEAQRARHRNMEAEAFFRLGWISFYEHHPRAAQRYLERAVEICKEREIHDTLLKASSFMGFVYAVLGKLREARPLLTEAMKLSDKLGSVEGKAWSMAYLVQYYNWIGEFKEALSLNRRLRLLNRTIKSPYFALLLHFREGLVYGALGRLKRARQSLEAGLKALEAGDDRFWRPRFLNTLGWVYAEGGDIKRALELNEEALSEALTVGDPETIHNAQINVGENHLALGNIALAEEFLERSWEEARKPGIFYTRWRYKTRLLIALAELWAIRGQKEKGLDFVRKALQLARRSGARKHEAKALFVRGRILAESRPKTALRSLDRARALANQMGTRNLARQITREIKAVNARSAMLSSSSMLTQKKYKKG